MIRKIAALLGGNLVFVASQWLVIVVLAKYVGLQAVGVYALSLAIVSPVYTLCNLGLRPVAATDVRGAHDFGDFMLLAAAGNVVAVAASIVIARAAFPENVDYAVLMALVAAKTVESVAFVFYGFLQRRDRISDVSRSLGGRGLLGVTAFALLLLGFEKYEWALFGIPLAWLLVLMALDFPRVKRSLAGGTQGERGLATRIDGAKILFVTAYPLGILASANVLSQQVPRYFIADGLSMEMLGIYAGIAQLALVGTTLVNAIGQTVVGRLALLHMENELAFSALYRKVLAAVGAVGVMGILLAYFAGGALLAFLYTDEFKEHEGVFVTAMVWSAVVYVSVALGSGLTSRRLFKQQSVVGIIGFVVTTVGSLLLIGPFGLHGAFAALILGVLVKLILQVAVMAQADWRKVARVESRD
jgi:O-antigen/teichoic acid export membrane protein